MPRLQLQRNPGNKGIEVPQENKKTKGKNGNGGNKKPQKRSLSDMLRGISSSKSGNQRPIYDRIHGIGRQSGGGGFSVAAYMTGGMIIPSHHSPGVGHKGPMRHG